MLLGIILNMVQVIGQELNCARNGKGDTIFVDSPVIWLKGARSYSCT